MMGDIDLVHSVITLSVIFSLVFGFSAYFKLEPILEYLPFVTQSIGVLWPLSLFVVLVLFIFNGVAGSQGVVFDEYESLVRNVLVTSGWLTLFFISPIPGAAIGHFFRAKSDSKNS